MLNDEPALRVDTVLFSSDVVRIGTFRCDTSDPLFGDSGPVQNHIFVFPRTCVRLHHDRGENFISGPNLVTLYNRGTRFRRTPVNGESDVCDWFAVSPDVLVDVLSASEPAVVERPDHPFARRCINSSSGLYLRQRRLVSALNSGAARSLSVEEEAVAILRELFAPHSWTENVPRSSRERVERVKELLSDVSSVPLSLRELASAVDLSVFHLCRIFRRHTGYSIHSFREEVSLRQSLERVEQGEDLLSLATELQYSSHSHFTSRFRKMFGAAPSKLRAELARTGVSESRGARR